MLYFAYGSNLNPHQMQRRCPGAQPEGRALLTNWRLILTSRGSANIVRAPGAGVHGALWRFEPRHLALMDRWEGVSRGVYRRYWCRVQCPNGEERSAVTYVGANASAGRGKAHYVLNTMLPGAVAFDLPPSFIDEILSWLPRRPIAAKRQYLGRRTPPAQRSDRRR
ncbi:MAG: gamma-glutamylcyclotransferase family protein [Hyphomicrobiaceae bacterium]